MKRKYHLVRKKLPEGGYITTIPELPGCVVVARSLNQEQSILPQAIAAYLALAKESGIQLPTDSHESFTISLITIEL